MKIKICALITLVSIIFSCQKNEIQKPVNYLGEDFIKTSKELGKEKEKEEKMYIENWIKQHPDDKYTPNSDGFWIKYDVENDNPSAKELNYVKYTAEFSDIEGTIIYSFKDFGEKSFIITKSHEIRAIERALLKMGKGEQVTILATSFNGYGLYGDEKKIGANQPLKIKLKLVDVKPL